MTKYLCIWVRAYWFSVTSFSKWLPGGHIRFLVSGWHGYGSVTQVCFGISVLNFMCMSFVAVSRSLTIVSYVAFKMAALWFWIMFNCNPPIAHCHPLLWGGGILVDHWSTISSCLFHGLNSYVAQTQPTRTQCVTTTVGCVIRLEACLIYTLWFVCCMK